MKFGAKPTLSDHRDYDLVRTMGAIAPKFPDSYDVDAGVWMPSQNEPQSVLGGIPALPWGCTSYTQADLDNDLAGVLKSNPMELEKITHANEQGGTDIRTAIKAAQSLKWLGSYFNVRASSGLDYFDAIRYAMLQGGFEKRSVSWGTPWFHEWQEEAIRGHKIMPMPDLRLSDAVGWHNSKFSGWVTINGVPYLKNKSWQGEDVGENGWIYFPREVVNAVMTVRGTCAFTASNYDGDIKRVSLPVVEMILSYLRNLKSLVY